MDFLLNHNIQFYIIAYLVGGIPFGLILAKYFAKIDVTSAGSGSIGATNVLRVLKEEKPKLAKKIAIATLACDVLKGILVLMVAKFIMNLSTETLWTIAILSVLGHCYSPYLKFEGGKGVATGMGVLFFMLPIETSLALLVWAIAAKTVKVSSVSSLMAILTLVFSSFVIHPQINDIQTHAPVLVIGFIIIYKHIPNIVRIFKGAEKRVV
jgi:glycerol-3-phosphate acyltransferase PlsY